MQWQAQEHFGNTFVRDATHGIITRTSCVNGGEARRLFVKAWRTEGFDLATFVSSVDGDNGLCGRTFIVAWVKEASLGEDVQAVYNP